MFLPFLNSMTWTFFVMFNKMKGVYFCLYGPLFGQNTNSNAKTNTSFFILINIFNNQNFPHYIIICDASLRCIHLLLSHTESHTHCYSNWSEGVVGIIFQCFFITHTPNQAYSQESTPLYHYGSYGAVNELKPLMKHLLKWWFQWNRCGGILTW